MEEIKKFSDLAKEEEDGEEDDDNQIGEIPDSIYIKIEDDVLNINEETFEEVFNEIQENPDILVFATGFIEYALKIRPKMVDILCELLVRLAEISKYTPRNLIKEHQDLLLKKGIVSKNSSLNKKLTKLNTKSELFKEGSFSEAIMYDDVETVMKKASKRCFDAKKKFTVTKYESLYFVTDDLEGTDDWRKNDILVSYMQLMAYFGSANCFKYALENGNFDESNLCKYAVAGGNPEIIDILKERGEEFKDCSEVAVRYHRYEISDWLTPDLDSDSVCLFYNDRVFYRYYNCCSIYAAAKTGNIDIAKCGIGEVNSYTLRADEDGYWPLSYAARNGQLELVKLIYENFNNEELTYWDNKSPLAMALYNNHLDIVEYLIEECGEKILPLQSFRNSSTGLYGCSIEETPINGVAINGHLEVIRYLVEKCGQDPNELNEHKRTPLINAAANNHLDVVRYLVEECHVDINAKDRNKMSALNYASQYSFGEILQYLVESGAILTEEDLKFARKKDFKEYLQEHLK